MPEDLWFSTEKCNDNTVVSEDCICLSGQICECQVEGNEFYGRWRGIVLTYVNDKGEITETEDFTALDFLKIIKSKNMRLTNMSAFFDTDVDVKLTKLVIADKDTETTIDMKIVDEIEFIS